MNEQELISALKGLDKKQLDSLTDLLAITPTKKKETSSWKKPEDMKYEVQYIQKCRLCDTKIVHKRMSSAKKDQVYEVPSCELCRETLATWSKEALIERLVLCADPFVAVKDEARKYKIYRKPEVSKHEVEAEHELRTIDGVQSTKESEVRTEEDELRELLSSEEFDARALGVTDEDVPEELGLDSEAD